MVLMGYSGARGTLIYEKNLMSKISCQTPFNRGTVFYIGDPDVIMSCLTCCTLSVWLWLRDARSLACQWQTHLANAMAY
jgi:hypothetical protein